MMTTPHIKLSKDICTELQNFRQHRKSSNELQRKINIAQEKLSSGGFQDVYSTDESNIETEYNTLKDMYQTALSTSQKEQDALLIALARIQDLIDKATGEDKKPIVAENAESNSPDSNKRGLKTPSADAPPNKKQKTGTPSTPTAQPPSRGKKTLPEEPQAGKQPAPTGDEEIKQGDKVAARVSGPTDDNENDMWILASFVKFLADKKKIEVEDEDDDSNQGKKHYKLGKKCVIQLPKVFNPNQIHAKGSQVLAMFPNTTTFYPAIVDREASKQSNNFYGLKFEDDEEGGKLVSRKVNFKYVIPLPKK